MTDKFIIKLVVPGQVRGKGRARSGQGRHYTPAPTRHYEQMISNVGAEAMAARLGDDYALLDKPLAVRVRATIAPTPSWPSWKREAALAGALAPVGKPDWDNIGKVLDGLSGVVWVDDTQVVQALVEKKYGVKPQLEITVRVLDTLGPKALKKDLSVDGH